MRRCEEGGTRMTYWDPHTPWERLPKWARVLLMALIVALLTWLVITLARMVASHDLHAIYPR
jgi:hypothetical protein